MGSRLGSPNKNKQLLMHRLRREFPNYHPVVELARIANDLGNSVDVRKDAHKEVAKYVTPQLKAVDVTHHGSPVVFNFSIGQKTDQLKLVQQEAGNLPAPLEQEIYDDEEQT